MTATVASSGSIIRSSRSNTSLAPLSRAASSTLMTSSLQAARQITTISAASTASRWVAMSASGMHSVRAPQASAALAMRVTR